MPDAAPVETGRVAALVRSWESRSPASTAKKAFFFPRRRGAPARSRRRRPNFPPELFALLVRFLPLEQRPVVHRAALASYVAKKNNRLNATPLLVDIWWHGGTCLGRYCVCRAVSTRERLDAYREDNPGRYACEPAA